MDPGEKVSVTLKREFLEEALDVANMTQEIEQQVREQVNQLFREGEEVLSSQMGQQLCAAVE